MRVSPPLWLNPPQANWIQCIVKNKIDPRGYLVELSLDGEERSIVVPEDSVRMDGDTFPAKGDLLVIVVAELPNDDPRMLTELPATPIAGSQRIKVSPSSLQPV